MCLYDRASESAYGVVTNEAASLDIIAAQGASTYVRLSKGILCVYEAAAGGGGVVELKDTNGTVIFRTNADGVKDIPMDWGEHGLKVNENLGLQFVVSGAQTKQASASLALEWYKSRI